MMRCMGVQELRSLVIHLWCTGAGLALPTPEWQAGDGPARFAAGLGFRWLIQPLWPQRAPVVAGEHLNEPPPERVQDSGFELSGRVLPVDLVDDHQVAGVDVRHLRALEDRYRTAVDVAAENGLGNAGDLRDSVERPAPGVANTQAEFASSRANCGLTAAKGGGDAGRRLHAEVGGKVPVVVGSPGRPVFVVELDAGCGPGDPEAREVAEHRVLRRIVPPLPTGCTRTADKGSPVAAGGRRLASCRVEGSQPYQHARSGPPSASSVRSSAWCPWMCGLVHWRMCLPVRVGTGDPARSPAAYQPQVIGTNTGRTPTAAPQLSTVRDWTDVQLPGDLRGGHPPNTALFPHGQEARSVGCAEPGPQPAGRCAMYISPEAFGQWLVASRQPRGAGATARPPWADGGVPHNGDERIATGLADSLELSHDRGHGARWPEAGGDWGSRRTPSAWIPAHMRNTPSKRAQPGRRSRCADRTRRAAHRERSVGWRSDQLPRAHRRLEGARMPVGG